VGSLGGAVALSAWWLSNMPFFLFQICCFGGCSLSPHGCASSRLYQSMAISGSFVAL